MQQIEIDFEVWKALTLHRQNERHSYNDVLRKLLKLPVASAAVGEEHQSADSGRSFSGRFMPDGTLFRARYKGALHEAEIRNGKLIGSGGASYSSASAAASAVTGNNVNGLSFWEIKRPGDTQWRKISLIAKSE